MAGNRVERVHTPAFLQGVSLGFKNREMIADKVCPRVPVGKQSDKYRVFGKNGLVLHESRWAPGTIPNEIEMRWSEDQYFAELRKLRTKITDTERRNADNEFDLESDATELVTNALMIGREKRVADLFITAANYSAGNVRAKAGGQEWDTLMATTPEVVFTDLLWAVGLASDSALVSMSALTAIIPEPVFRKAIMRNAAVIDSIKYTQGPQAAQGGWITPQLLAAALGIKEVILAASMAAGAGPEKAGSDVVTGYTVTNLWGDTVWVGLINEGQNDRVPCFARSFNWRAETGGQDRQVRKYRVDDEGTEADWIECKEAIGEKIVYKDAGAIVTNTLA